MKHRKLDTTQFVDYLFDLEQYSSLYEWDSKVKLIQQLSSFSLEPTHSPLQFKIFISKNSLQIDDILFQIGRILVLDEKDFYFFSHSASLVSTWNEISMLLFWKRELESSPHFSILLPLIEAYYISLKEQYDPTTILNSFTLLSYPDLINYCKNQLQMHIDSRISLAKHEQFGTCLIATEYIPSNTTVLSIPLQSVISRETVCERYPQTFGKLSAMVQDDSLFLQLFLLSQLPKQENSYLQYLPKECDKNSPLQICSSELHHFIHPSLPLYHEVIENHNQLQELVTNHNSNSNTYSLIELPTDLKEEHFLWSKWIIDSRTFLQQNKLCLVPFVDYLNSSEIPNMEYKGFINRQTERFEFRTMIPIQSNEQLMIRYGNYGNRESWLFYGYLLPNCSNDVLHLEVETEEQIEEIYLKWNNPNSTTPQQKLILEQLLQQMQEDEIEYCNTYTPMQIELIKNNLYQ